MKKNFYNLNENIDLREILKDCKSGTKLYCTIYGEVEFEFIRGVDIEPNYPYCIQVHSSITNMPYSFTKEGKYFDAPEGECVLFPSKEQRDWNLFNPLSQNNNSVYNLKPYDKIIVRKKVMDNYIWFPAYYRFYSNNAFRHFTDAGWFTSNDILPFENNENKVGLIE